MITTNLSSRAFLRKKSLASSDAPTSSEEEDDGEIHFLQPSLEVRKYAFETNSKVQTLYNANSHTTLHPSKNNVHHDVHQNNNAASVRRSKSDIQEKKKLFNFQPSCHRHRRKSHDDVVNSRKESISEPLETPRSHCTSPTRRLSVSHTTTPLQTQKPHHSETATVSENLRPCETRKQNRQHHTTTHSKLKNLFRPHSSGELQDNKYVDEIGNVYVSNVASSPTILTTKQHKLLPKRPSKLTQSTSVDPQEICKVKTGIKIKKKRLSLSLSTKKKFTQESEKQHTPTNSQNNCIIMEENFQISSPESFADRVVSKRNKTFKTLQYSDSASPSKFFSLSYSGFLLFFTLLSCSFLQFA